MADAIACIACGYNLRGLSINGACPECGEAVEHSMRGDRLKYADAQWLELLLRGLRGIAISIWMLFCWIVLMLALGLLGTLVLPRNQDTRAEAVFETALVIVGLLLLLPVIILCLGLWQTSTPEPRAEAENPRLAIALRVLNVAALPVIGIWLLSISGLFPWLTRHPIALQAAIHFCYAILWLHVLVITNQTLDLRRRCKSARHESLAPDAKRRRLTVWAPFIFLALYWIGPLRSVTAGWFSLPPDGTQRALFFFSALIWMSTVANLAPLRRSIIEELELPTPA